MNPVTIQPYGPPFELNQVVLGRLAFGIGGQHIEPQMQICVVEPGAEKDPSKIHLAQVKQDQFLFGLSHLFPDGELFTAVTMAGKGRTVATIPIDAPVGTWQRMLQRNLVLQSQYQVLKLAAAARRAVGIIRSLDNSSVEIGPEQPIRAASVIEDLCLALGEKPDSYPGTP